MRISEVIYANHSKECLADSRRLANVRSPSRPSFPFPCGGREPRGSKSLSPASSADPQTLPGPHLQPTPPLPGASPQGPAPPPHRAFTVSSCAGKGPEMMFLAVSTLSQQRKQLVCGETQPPGGSADSTDRSALSYLNASLLPSHPIPPKQAWREDVSFSCFFG